MNNQQMQNFKKSLSIFDKDLQRLNAFFKEGENTISSLNSVDARQFRKQMNELNNLQEALLTVKRSMHI